MGKGDKYICRHSLAASICHRKWMSFQATALATFYSSSVYCTLANHKVFLRQKNSGLQTQQYPIRQVEVLAVEGLTPKER